MSRKRGEPRLFAEGTTVDASKSRAEIEKLVNKQGATSFASGWQGSKATILFECNKRRVRFELSTVPVVGMDTRAEAENRRRWRCLLLVIKAKFEAIASGITEFDEEFLAHIVVPGTGETMAQWAGPQLVAAYERGVNMPPLLGAGGSP